jgi:hypothetical protein
MGSSRADRLAIAGAAAALLAGYGLLVRHGPALADEFVYLAGARHFALTGSLDARYYDAAGILMRGHPQQDVHPPGYVLALGALTALFPFGYWTAVGLNALAYVAAALLMRSFALSAGFDSRTALASALLFLILPTCLPFVFWVMPEILLAALFLGSLVAAQRLGHRATGAVLAGVLVGLGILVRETMMIGALAVGVVLWSRRRLAPFLVALLAFVVVVHAPLSRSRAPGGVNFWAETKPDPRRPGAAFGAVQAARRGQVAQAADSAWRRLRSNGRELAAAGLTEQSLLALYAAVPVLALVRRREQDDRRLLLSLGAVFVLTLCAVVLLLVITRWSGFRYLMFAVPPLLPWLARPSVPGDTRARAAVGVGMAVACLGLLAAVREVHETYKASRQRRWEAIAAYVDRYVGPVPITRIALPDGWAFGLARYPTEVISSLPASPGQLRHLERAIWFDYLVVPAGSAYAEETDARERYRLLNVEDPDPPLKVYRRLH